MMEGPRARQKENNVKTVGLISVSRRSDRRLGGEEFIHVRALGKLAAVCAV